MKSNKTINQIKSKRMKLTESRIPSGQGIQSQEEARARICLESGQGVLSPADGESNPKRTRVRGFAQKVDRASNPQRTGNPIPRGGACENLPRN